MLEEGEFPEWWSRHVKGALDVVYVLTIMYSVFGRGARCFVDVVVPLCLTLCGLVYHKDQRKHSSGGGLRFGVALA